MEYKKIMTDKELQAKVLDIANLQDLLSTAD